MIIADNDWPDCRLATAESFSKTQENFRRMLISADFHADECPDFADD
jgi:hypothetical protein